MTIEATTGAILWTPSGTQGGTQTVTVRGTNAGGTADLTFTVETLFTGAVTNVVVTGTTLAEPTATWVAPTGEGSVLVTSYSIHGFAEWGVGRTRQTHSVDYTVPASETSALMTGLVTGKGYTLTVTALDAAGNRGDANTGTLFASTPALPQIRWSVNGFSGGVSTPAPVVVAKPMQIILTDERPEPSEISLISGPADLTFDPVTKIASWTPTAADVNIGYGNTDVVFEASNSVGTVTVSVPVHVYFSGAVKNLSATRYGTAAATATWDPPNDNVTPITSYEVTMHWTWSGRPRSRSWTISGDSTSVSYSLVPTGAVSHKGVTIVPIDANGNRGVSSGKVLYGAATNAIPPIAVDDTCDAVEDTPLVVNSVDGVRANDIDTDNTPFINPLLARRVANPTNGTLTLDQFGDFTYVPDADFHGVDSFTYLVNDGAFDSNIATVTIHVASVNDTPTALDDYYSVAQDTPLTVDASTGVQANDSDVDGDILNVRVLSDPANGALTLNPDGSFIYTPNANFTGADGFTYVANDSLIDSRTVTVAVTVNATTPPATGTCFYVVDFDDRATFEYDTNGELVETYGLPNANRKPPGVAANADGSLIWTIDKQKRVFIYDNAGTELGMWVPQGLTKPDGIATDGTDILIVDRDSDTIFRYAGEANRRNGEAAATSSFALDRANGNPRGITTDGTSIWVVNSAGTDRVFKYDMTGTFLGRWDIDPANDRPTGITIDPTGTSDAIWIVDNLSDTVYQYDGGATRIGGSAVADSVFTLAATNTNPQGIADPSSLSATEILVQSDASAPNARYEFNDIANWGERWSDIPVRRECVFEPVYKRRFVAQSRRIAVIRKRRSVAVCGVRCSGSRSRRSSTFYGVRSI